MSEPKLTPWFPGHIKPVRPGIYRVWWYLAPTYARFDGRRWMAGNHNGPADAALVVAPASCHPLKWRGLAEQPK